jgi:hypothetical protein
MLVEIGSAELHIQRCRGRLRIQKELLFLVALTRSRESNPDGQLGRLEHNHYATTRGTKTNVWSRRGGGVASFLSFARRSYHTHLLLYARTVSLHRAKPPHTEPTQGIEPCSPVYKTGASPVMLCRQAVVLGSTNPVEERRSAAVSSHHKTCSRLRGLDG